MYGESLQQCVRELVNDMVVLKDEILTGHVYSLEEVSHWLDTTISNIDTEYGDLLK